MDRKRFKKFVDDMVLLGYGEADLELMLWHCFLNDNIKGMETLPDRGWDDKIHDTNVTDIGMYFRYEEARSAPWAKKRLKDAKWVAKRVDELEKRGIRFRK